VKREALAPKHDIGDRITADPNVKVGKPVVLGTRIPVERVLEQLAYNPDLNELFAAYPRLTFDDVTAVLPMHSEQCPAPAPTHVSGKLQFRLRKPTPVFRTFAFPRQI